MQGVGGMRTQISASYKSDNLYANPFVYFYTCYDELIIYEK
jgi:hypothetical protein